MAPTSSGAGKRTPRSAPPPTVRRLDGRPVGAAWGAPELLAPFTDRPRSETLTPEAEVWYGAHPRHTSWVVTDGERREASALAPAEQPPLLMKLLAASAPLSIQVHPDDATAARGFALEEAAGVPSDVHERHFVDASGKPELVRALGPMRVLCGLRPAAASRALLSALVPDGADVLLEALAHGDAALGEAVATVLRADAVTLSVLHAAVLDGAHDVVARAESLAGGPDTEREVLRLAQLAIDLQTRYPGDAATLVALLLEDVDLAPGEAIAVAPGTPHAYLSGVGVEVMAPSDNVLRAGMTVKHVDVEAFLAVLDTSRVGVPRVGTLPRRAGGVGWRRHITPFDAFVLDEARVEGALLVERNGATPAIVLCVEGGVTVRAEDGSVVELGPGGAALLAAGIGPVELRGQGLVMSATRLRRIERVPTSV